MSDTGKTGQVSVDSVVFATDFSACSENAGQYARLLAVRFHAALLVAHSFALTQAALEVESGLGKSSVQREQLKELLASKAEALSSGSLQPVPVLLEGIPQETIPALSKKHAPSNIVLGTHGAGRVEHGLVGSNAERILRSANCPCLTVGPHTAAAGPSALPFRRILYATDLSEAAAHAAPYALTFAAEEDCDLDVLHVVPGGGGHGSRWEELERGYHQMLERLIPREARELCRAHTFVEEGNAHDRILGHIRDAGVDLMVLGIRKSSYLGLEMRLSGAFRLIADAPCPVLTVTG